MSHLIQASERGVLDDPDLLANVGARGFTDNPVLAGS
jgi:hypothetical protein